MQPLSKKAAQYHASDLYDIESCVMDLSEHTKVLAPILALNVGQPLPANASEVGASGELWTAPKFTRRSCLLPSWG